jgi:hypothetical protein
LEVISIPLKGKSPRRKLEIFGRAERDRNNDKDRKDQVHKDDYTENIEEELPERKTSIFPSISKHR